MRSWVETERTTWSISPRTHAFRHLLHHASTYCPSSSTSAISSGVILQPPIIWPMFPIMPPMPLRISVTFRHGTLSLYAAFNTRTGTVLGKTAQRHTSAEFVAFLTDLVASQPSKKEIHVITDNLSAHKSCFECPLSANGLCLDRSP
jgi:hypothetical protein